MKNKLTKICLVLSVIAASSISAVAQAGEIGWNELQADYTKFDFQDAPVMNGAGIKGSVDLSNGWTATVNHERVSDDLLIEDLKKTSLGVGWHATVKNIEAPTDVELKAQRGSLSVGDLDNSYWTWSAGLRTQATQNFQVGLAFSYESYSGQLDSELSGNGIEGYARYEFNEHVAAQLSGKSSTYDTFGVGLVYSF